MEMTVSAKALQRHKEYDVQEGRPVVIPEGTHRSDYDRLSTSERRLGRRKPDIRSIYLRRVLRFSSGNFLACCYDRLGAKEGEQPNNLQEATGRIRDIIGKIGIFRSAENEKSL